MGEIHILTGALLKATNTASLPNWINIPFKAIFLGGTIFGL